MKTFLENQLLNLDLHGVRHSDVEVAVEDFVLNNQQQLPLIVICGNSSKMIDIVSKTLKKMEINFEETRYGRIRINSLMRKLKIIQILPSLNTGGVERGVLDFNKYLVAKGHQSYVISNGGRQVKNLIDEGGSIFICKSPIRACSHYCKQKNLPQ